MVIYIQNKTLLQKGKGYIQGCPPGHEEKKSERKKTLLKGVGALIPSIHQNKHVRHHAIQTVPHSSYVGLNNELLHH